jgi:transcriptional regulator with XRE-family HTH domain
MSLLNTRKIVELREHRGWDQYELAKAANVHASVISRLERSLQKDFKLSVVLSIATALGVTVNEIIQTTNQNETNQQSLLPELQEMFDRLSLKTAVIQRQAAGILRGYLSTID